MPDNSRFVFSVGNQWTDDDTAPYFVLPSAWRRFIFHILNPRELTVYLYVCSLTDRNAIAYPTVQQIAEDLGVKSRQTISAALDQLTNLGFLLRQKQERGFLRGRMVYQRPAPHYTLFQLLGDTGSNTNAADQHVHRAPVFAYVGGDPIIDAELYPIGTEPSEAMMRSDGAVQAHLQKLLGELYMAYIAASPERRSSVLKAALLEQLDTMITAAKNKLLAKQSKQEKVQQRALEDLPEHIRNMIPTNKAEAVVLRAK